MNGGGGGLEKPSQRRPQIWGWKANRCCCQEDGVPEWMMEVSTVEFNFPMLKSEDGGRSLLNGGAE